MRSTEIGERGRAETRNRQIKAQRRGKANVPRRQRFINITIPPLGSSLMIRASPRAIRAARMNAQARPLYSAPKTRGIRWPEDIRPAVSGRSASGRWCLAAVALPSCRLLQTHSGRASWRQRPT